MKLRLLLFYLLGILLAGCGNPPVGQSPTPTLTTFPFMDSVRVMVSTVANEQIEELADLTRRTRKEQAACVSSYGYVPGKAGWIAVLLELSPSNPYESDSLMIWTLHNKPFCRPADVNVHTHIVANEAWGRPSEWDMAHRYDWSEAPFKVVVSVRDRRPSKVTVYGIR